MFGRERDEGAVEAPTPRPSVRDGAPVSLIGEGMTITGNITVDGTLRIEGNLKGNVDATQSVVLGPHSVVEGDIKAQDAIIGGRVRGGIATTGRLELHATCDVDGDIDAVRFKMDEGGRVSGHVRIGRAASAQSGRPAPAKP